MKKMVSWLAASCLVVLMSGCGSVRLYNKEADAAATSAKTDYDASKVTEALKGEGAMLDGLEAREVDAYRKTTQAERNFQLLSLVNESGSSATRTTSNGVVLRIYDQVNTRLVDLLGTVADPLATLRELDLNKRAVQDAELKEKQARAQLVTFNAKLSSLPACNEGVASLKDKSSADAAAALIKDASFIPANIPTSGAWTGPIKLLGTTCDQLLGARATLNESLKKLPSKQVRIAISAVQSEQEALTLAQDIAKVAAVELKSAATNLATAQKAANEAAEGEHLTCDFFKASNALGSEVEKEKSALCDALNKLSRLGDFGIKLLSEERLARINTVLAAMSGIEPAADEPPLESSLALLSVSSRFSHVLKTYQKTKTLPALEPLLIERQLATAQLNYAQGGLNLAKARLRYAQDYMDASLQEVYLLLKAKAELGALGTPPGPKMACTKTSPVFCASMNQLLTEKALSNPALGGGETAGRRTYRALAFISESFSVARDRQRTAEVRLIDTDYRDSLLRSEASVAAWNALVSVPIDQLAALYKDGWTPLEIAQFLQSFGVLGVAARLK